MTFDEILEKFQTEDPEKIILQALAYVKQELTDASTLADKASKAYYANVAEQEQKIAARIELLKKEHISIQAKIDELKKPLIAATVSDDAKKLVDIKDSLKSLEADKLQLSTEIERLESFHVIGDEALYTDVVKKNAHFLETQKAYEEARKRAYKLAVLREESYQAIQRETKHYWTNAAYGPDMKKLEKHFNFEKYAKLEQEAKSLSTDNLGRKEA